jgi:hypothetical protein
VSKEQNIFPVFLFFRTSHPPSIETTSEIKKGRKDEKKAEKLVNEK